jgi:hypothetical protein
VADLNHGLTRGATFAIASFVETSAPSPR